MDSHTNFYVPLTEVVCACNLGLVSTNGGDNCDRSVTYRQGTASSASYYTYYVIVLLLVIILCLGACASGKVFRRSMDTSKGIGGAVTKMLPTGGERWVQEALQSTAKALDVGMGEDRYAAQNRPVQEQQRQPKQYPRDAPQAVEYQSDTHPNAQQHAAPPAGGMPSGREVPGQQAPVSSARGPSTAGDSVAGSTSGMGRVRPRQPAALAATSSQRSSIPLASDPSMVAGNSLAGIVTKSATGFARVQPRQATGMSAATSFETETLPRAGRRVRPRATIPRGAPPSLRSIQSVGRTGTE